MVTSQRYIDASRPLGFRELARLTWNALRSYISGPLTSAQLGVDGSRTVAGVTVSETTALNISAVWNAVQIISGTVGSLPLILYKRLSDGGKERYTDHRLYRILHDEPNPEMTAMVFRETLQEHVLLWGNGYAEIQRDEGGRPLALWPITPERVTPRRDPARRLYYEVTNERGVKSRISPGDILHIPGLGFDGCQGYSVIARARESLGLTLGVERFGASLFGNMAMGGAVLETSKPMLPQTKGALKAQLDEYRREGSHGHLILDDGLTYKQTSIPPNDSQFLETRKFQVTEVARWFNLPPHKLKDLERATFSNIEHQGIDFLTDSIRPWLVRWEQEINRKLIAPLERRQQFAEHLVDALLRGDTQSRYQAYAVGRQWGWLSADDVRERENMNPLPNGAGKIYLVPQNMAPADRINEVIDAQIEPEPAPEPVPDDPSQERAEVPPTVSMGDVKELVERLIADAKPGPTLPREEPLGRPQLIAGHRTLVADLAGRMIRQETYKLRRAASTPERLRAWVEAFYPKHAEKFAGALLPAVQSHLAMLPDGGDPEAYARGLVAEHIDQSRAQLHALLDAQPTDLGEAVEHLASRWEIERPALIADRILQEEIAHAA